MLYLSFLDDDMPIFALQNHPSETHMVYLHFIWTIITGYIIYRLHSVGHILYMTIISHKGGRVGISGPAHWNLKK